MMYLLGNVIPLCTIPAILTYSQFILVASIANYYHQWYQNTDIKN
jgi:hypothetical protein